MQTWKTLALCAALALSPALASAQSTPGSMTTPPATTPSTDQTTKPADASDQTPYQKERAACDRKDLAAQDTCRNAVDQKYNKKPMSAPGQSSAPESQGTSKSTY